MKLTKKQKKLLKDWLGAVESPPMRDGKYDYLEGYQVAADVVRRILATDSPSKLDAIRGEVLA